MIRTQLLKLATILAVLPAGMTLAHAQAITADEINAATFEAWQTELLSQNNEAVLKIDQKSGDVEAADPGKDGDAAKVAVPGEADAVVETPEQSTDVPDEAAAQVETDPQAEQELEKAEAAPELDKVAEDQETADPFLVKLQVMLDRAYASPGEIDGKLGDNTRKAIAAYRLMQGLEAGHEIDPELWSKLSSDSNAPVVSYTITEEDVGTEFVPDLPEDYADMAELKRLDYRTITEMLAERFHMDEDLLKALNPDADFSKAGTEISVLAPGGDPQGEITRIVVDKKAGELRAYAGADADAPIFVAPATIGSQDTPSPEGTLKVEVVVRDPTYSYNPDKNFKQGDNTEKLELPAGPNGPVGNIWIDLSKPTYGIHGTDMPNLVNKSESHGCVRLTNWDAARVADLVKPKETVVEFAE